MGLESLRKHIQELKERGILGSGYETPEMNTYQPTKPSAVEPYNPPKVAAPFSTNTQMPKTTPVSAPKSVVTAVNTPNSTAKVDPKTGQAGLKAFTDITSKSPQFGEAGIGNTDLIDAYNAGLNGKDLSRETRDNAATGGYLDSIEAMFNAGLQDASLSKNVDGFSPKKVDNDKDLSYTPSTTFGDTGAYKNPDDWDDPYIDNFTPGPNTVYTFEDYSFPFITSQREKDYNYMEDMLFLNGAASSSDPDIQKAYEYLINYENRGKQIPEEIMDAFNRFMKDLKNGTNTADSYSGANNSAMNVQMALQYINDPKNQGKISPETVKAIMGKPTAQDLSTQTMRDDQIRRSQQTALDADNIDYYTYDMLKARNILKLGVSHDKRQSGLWCWAACMSTIDNFYNGGEGITQKTLHSEVRESDTSRTKDTDFGVPDCKPFVNFTLDKKVHEVPLYETIEANMRAGQPIVLHTRKPWEEKPKHFIVITGCYVRDGVRYVIINENRNGRQYNIPFNELGKGFTTFDDAQLVEGYYTTSKN